MKATQIISLLFSPQNLRAVIQWKLFHEPVHRRDVALESPSLQRCYELLDTTSRSFSAVIKEVHPELRDPIMLFYLILRALDTIEDDMTIPNATKIPLLTSFHTFLYKKSWTFDGNGPDEKDRQLLVEFDVVIDEFSKIKPQYQTIIKEITAEMGEGMAHYCLDSDFLTKGIDTLQDFDRYCHYVAGIVGEGLTRLVVEAKLGDPSLINRMDLANSMGLFLQKTNIIRDFREDLDDGRVFWPRKIWKKYLPEKKLSSKSESSTSSSFSSSSISSSFSICEKNSTTPSSSSSSSLELSTDGLEQLAIESNRERAMFCVTELIANALSHIPDCLTYLSKVNEQSVFNFCAIPQVMAIATLAHVFVNCRSEVFEKHVKISRPTSLRLMIDANSLENVAKIFKHYVNQIHHAVSPADPNYLKMEIACAQIVQAIEEHFPTYKVFGNNVVYVKGMSPDQILSLKEKYTSQIYNNKNEDTKDTIIFALTVIGSLLLFTSIATFIAYLAGARFDLVFSDLKSIFHSA